MANTQKDKREIAFKNSNELPHSIEAESALLCCLILDPQIQVEAMAFLSEDDFFIQSHKIIFNAINEIVKLNKTVDFVTLIDYLEKNGLLKQAGDIEYIAEITNKVPSSAGYMRYVDIVSRDGMLRKLIKGSAEIIDNCKKSTDEKDSLSFAEKTIYEISNTADTSEMVKVNEVLPEVLTKLDNLATDKSKYKGIKTNFKSLDYLINGVHGSDLMILAARPAMGKTSFAMNLVENIAKQGYSCAVFSLEMGKEQLVQRLLCSMASVSNENANKGQLSRQDWLKIKQAEQKLATMKVFIDDSSIITAREMLSKCRRLQRKVGLDFVMVDYIQLMSSESKRNSDSRQNEISEISRNLKILAKELNVPVLALSQLSRSVEKDGRRPQLSDLRESGAIEQDADIVMFIHRPDLRPSKDDIKEDSIKKNVAEIIVAKHRNGRTDTIRLYFKGECTKFLNLNEESGEPDEEHDEKENKTSQQSAPELMEVKNDVDEDIFG